MKDILIKLLSCKFKTRARIANIFVFIVGLIEFKQ